MDIVQKIAERRSIRQFKADQLSRDEIEPLLKAGMNAPSARNTQPWHFLVITQRDTLDKLVEICPNGAMLKGAPAAILVMGDLGLTDDYWIIDCAAAVQNILLAASGEGLGACWIGVHPRQPRVEGLKKLFGLPEEIMPHSLIALGHPAETKEPNDRYLADRVRYEGWK